MNFSFQYKGITNEVQVDPKHSYCTITKMNGTPSTHSAEEVQWWRWEVPDYFDALMEAYEKALQEGK